MNLRTLILWPFVLVCVTLGAVLGYWSYRSDLRAAEEVGAELNRRVAQQVHEGLNSLLSTPEHLLEANVGRIEEQSLSGSVSEELQRSLVDQVRAFPNLTNLAFGAAEGQYVCAYRVWSRPDLVMLSLAEPESALNSYVLDVDGRPSSLYSSEDGFRVTSRPWYRAAAASREAVWFEPYTFFSGETLALGMARSIRDENGRVLGVLAADIALEELGRHLESLELKEGGHAFVMELHGDLVADSSGQTALVRSKDGPRRLQAEDSPVEAVRLASRATLERLPAGGPREFSARVEGQSEAYLVHAFRHLRPGGLELLVGVSVPLESYLEPLTAGMRQRFVLAGLVLLLGLVAVHKIAQAISRPVEELSDAAQRVAEGDWSDEAPHSRVREIEDLSSAFSTMARRLTSTMDSLEQRVQERTSDLAAANERLSELSRTDQLTGVANRRVFDEALEREWRRSGRTGQPVTLFLCDLDWFKQYNDRFGHLAGDQALIRVARKLQSLARRSGDVLARMGGEEFFFLLPDLGCEDATRLAEAVRRAVLDLELSHPDSSFGRVSLSIGVVTNVASGHSYEASEIRELIQRGDEALYRAKSRGRNRIEVSGLWTANG